MGTNKMASSGGREEKESFFRQDDRMEQDFLGEFFLDRMEQDFFRRREWFVCKFFSFLDVCLFFYSCSFVSSVVSIFVFYSAVLYSLFYLMFSRMFLQASV